MVSPRPRFTFRRRTVLHVVITVAWCAVSVWPSRLEACSCAGPGLACEAAWQADAVFVGRVVAVDSLPAAAAAGRRVDMTVVESFSGFQLSQVSVFTGYGSTDCGVSFDMGESYLVYAHQSREGRFTTSSCTRTSSVSRATEDLAYLRSLKGADGTFELRLVTPGDYLLAFNHLPTLYERDALPRAFYPGVIDPAGARAISVSARDRVRLRDFVVPPAIPLVLVQGWSWTPRAAPFRTPPSRWRMTTSARTQLVRRL